MGKEVLRMTFIRSANGMELGNLELDKGEILFLLGMADSGKNEMLRIITGLEKKTGGFMFYEGKNIQVQSLAHAQQIGIYYIQNRTMLISRLRIIENISVIQSQNNNKVFINNNKMALETENLLKSLHFRIDIRKKINEISFSDAKLVEICRAIAAGSKVIILDNFYESYTIAEMQPLSNMIRNLANMGVSFIISMDKPGHMFIPGDRVVVFRNGMRVKELIPPEYSQFNFITHMTGKEPSTLVAPNPNYNEAPIARVVDICTNGMLQKVSFDVMRNEVLALIDFDCYDGHRLAEILAGIKISEHDCNILIDNKKFNPRCIEDAVNQGVCCYCGIDCSYFSNLSVAENLSTLTIKKTSRHFGFINKRIERYLQEEYIKQEQEKEKKDATNAASLLEKLKIICFRWRKSKIRLIILIEPFAGLDLAVKNYFVSQLYRLAAEGVGILIVSRNFEQVSDSFNRAIILTKNKIPIEFKQGEIDFRDVLSYMLHS